MPENLTNIPVPTPPGKRPRTTNRDWRTQVRQYQNLNAPHVEYRFSNGRLFIRRDGESGIYD